MSEMKADHLIEMLAETTQLDEQASIVHYLWMKWCGSVRVSGYCDVISFRLYRLMALRESGCV